MTLLPNIAASLRIALATLVVCAGGYSLCILAIARLVPATASGSLVSLPDGRVVGSRLVGQNFTQPGYFWPRPSAAGEGGYDATAAAGSNKSPTSPELTERAQSLVARYGATPERPLPAELAAASGGGLDPHISLRAAIYQSDRVAKARGLPTMKVVALARQNAFAPGGFLTPDPIVNVLELNIALDRLSAEQ